MMNELFWVTLRSVGIPIAAYFMLRNSFIGEQGTILAIGIAMFIVTGISFIWNFLKIIGNTLLLRGEVVIILFIKVLIQIVSLGFVWIYYLERFTDVL